MPQRFRVFQMTTIARLIAFMVIAWFPYAATAHEAPSGWKYDAICCNGDAHTGDCQRVEASTVKAVEGGWRVTLEVGDHQLVTRPHVFLKAYDKTRASKDGDFHVCLWPTQDSLRCLYVPDMGM
jgi:hypothetical protein